MKKIHHLTDPLDSFKILHLINYTKFTSHLNFQYIFDHVSTYIITHI